MAPASEPAGDGRQGWQRSHWCWVPLWAARGSCGWEDMAPLHILGACGISKCLPLILEGLLRIYIRLEGRFKDWPAAGSAEEKVPFPVTTEIWLHPTVGVFGSGAVVCQLEKSLVLLWWGLDLVDNLELCQGLMFPFRGLGCRRVLACPSCPAEHRDEHGAGTGPSGTGIGPSPKLPCSQFC